MSDHVPLSPPALDILSLTGSRRSERNRIAVMKIAQSMTTALAVICVLIMQGCGGNGASPTVTPKQSAPTITAQPMSQTVPSGQTAKFTVTATGSPTPTYQWLLDGSPIAGASGASYTTPALTTASSGDTYTVTATNSLGTVTSGHATVTVTNIASAVLAPSVLLLSAAQEASITATTPSSVTFSQAIIFAPGAVALGANHVFKVLSSTIAGSQTVVTVTDPELGEIFSSLIVQGSYMADPSMAVPAAAVAVQKLGTRIRPRDTGSGSYTFSWPFTLSDGGFSLSSTLSSTVSAFVDYSFQNGTLHQGDLDVTFNSQVALDESFSAQAMASTEQKLGSVTIPIPVSVVDSALESLGIYTLALNIPAYAGVSLQSGFEASLTQTLSTTGAVNLSYDPNNGPAASSSFTASYSPNALDPAAPAGSPLATFSENGSVYVRIAPALAFVNSLALLGVDTRISLDDEASLQLNTGSPPYCLSNDFNVDLAANGFFKAIGIAPITTPTYSTALYQGTPQETGTCRAAVEVSALAGATEPIPYRASVPLTVTVAPDKSDSPAPASVPTGSVTVLGGGSACEATLATHSATSATATCNLSPLSAGSSVPVSVNYSGDANFSPGTAQISLNISDSQNSLLGSLVTLIEEDPLDTPITQAVTVRAGPGIAFSSGNLVTLDNQRVIGSTLVVGANFIDVSYTVAATAAVSSFNGPVFTLGAGAPSILGCSLDQASTFSSSQIQVSCTTNEVSINASGISTTTASDILVDLQLGPAVQ
jgi:hypothetical protein